MLFLEPFLYLLDKESRESAVQNNLTIFRTCFNETLDSLEGLDEEERRRLRSLLQFKVELLDEILYERHKDGPASMVPEATMNEHIVALRLSFEMQCEKLLAGKTMGAVEPYFKGVGWWDYTEQTGPEYPKNTTLIGDFNLWFRLSYYLRKRVRSLFTNEAIETAFHRL